MYKKKNNMQIRRHSNFKPARIKSDKNDIDGVKIMLIHGGQVSFRLLLLGHDF